MMQYELYDGMPPHAARMTSFQAAQQIEPATVSLRRKVLAFLKLQGELGATDEEIQILMGMPANTQRPRRRELEMAGLICDSGHRRLTQARRKAVVWVVA